MNGSCSTDRCAGRVVLLLVLLLAFGLRVHQLGSQSLWYDEAVTSQVAARGIAELTRWTADDIQPPLYYYAIAAWTRLTGPGVGREWILRYPSAAAGVLIVALIGSVARRLFGRGRAGRAASWAAAGMAALHPLYVYFAQEARMYSMLTLLALLSGYALLRAARGEGSRASLGWWAAFVLAAAAMLYTHYFGIFMVAALALWFLVAWSVGVRRMGCTSAGRAVVQLAPAGAAFGRPGASKLAAGATAFALVFVLYLPWLPAMLGRYHLDRSYWLGDLKMGEALRHVAISYTSGAPETMLEPDAVRLLPWFGVALVIALIALLWARHPSPALAGRRAVSRSPLLFLLTVLVVTVSAALVLAARNPKFNPRYLMLASPCYVLLLAGGIGALWSGVSSWRGEAGPKMAAERSEVLRGVTRAGSVLILLFLLATSVVSLRNWFVNPAFTKAQWRELAAFVGAHISPGERVLLVSGHAAPAWNTYAPGIDPVRLPEIDVLDVEAVLGFEIGALLQENLAGCSGVWLVQWQDETVDPVGIVPHLLARAGEELPVRSRFWHLGLRHWRLGSDVSFPSEPRPQQRDGANFDHQIALLGWDQPEDGQVTLYWSALNTILRDYQVSLVFEDAGGHEVARWDGRPSGYAYPTYRWRPGQALFGRYPVDLGDASSAGGIMLSVAVYDALDPSGLDIRDEADNPAGKRIRLGPLQWKPDGD